LFFFFFFQAEDGIRDKLVTGVQTCALPISGGLSLCLLIISVTATWFVMHGRQPFPSASLRENVLSLQVLLCTVVLPLMFVSGFMTEARHTQASLRRLSANLINAQEQERTRIGRELHDDVNQKLAMLSTELQQLRTNPSDVHG